MRADDFDTYQQAAISTAIYPKSMSVIYPALGLSGETGEVCDKIKKVIRDENGIFDMSSKEHIKKELGDVLWYIANTASDLGIKLSDIAIGNIQKLQSRKENGTLQGSGDDR